MSYGRRAKKKTSAWERGPVNVDRGGGVTEVAQGEILDGSGLGIFHKKPQWGIVGWSVTHLESGLSLGSTKLKREARAMVEEIVAAVPGIGWMSAPEIAAHGEVVHPIVRRYWW
jgi:hypothetical protein